MKKLGSIKFKNFQQQKCQGVALTEFAIFITIYLFLINGFYSFFTKSSHHYTKKFSELSHSLSVCGLSLKAHRSHLWDLHNYHSTLQHSLKHFETRHKTLGRPVNPSTFMNAVIPKILGDAFAFQTASCVAEYCLSGNCLALPMAVAGVSQIIGLYKIGLKPTGCPLFHAVHEKNHFAVQNLFKKRWDLLSRQENLSFKNLLQKNLPTL